MFDTVIRDSNPTHLSDFAQHIPSKGLHLFSVNSDKHSSEVLTTQSKNRRVIDELQRVR